MNLFCEMDISRLALLMCFHLYILYIGRVEGRIDDIWSGDTNNDRQYEELNPIRRSVDATRASSIQDDPLRRQYKLEDFFLLGSGVSPSEVNADGGLSWDDSSGSAPILSSLVKVTRTMVLYKTVVSTVYPVGMTPSIVIDSHHHPHASESWFATPKLDSAIRQQSSSSSHDHGIDSSPTIQVEVTAKVPNSGTLPSFAGIHEINGTNLYLVETTIRANSTVLRHEPRFRRSMEEKLAVVYAVAFKRNFLQSLGVPFSDIKQERNNRPKRWADEEIDLLDPSHSFSTTLVNVSVTIVNITVDEPDAHLHMKYLVKAEGTPVPALSAVQDIQTVSLRDMEKVIGYEIILQAQAVLPLDPVPVEAKGTIWPLILIIAILLLLTFVAVTVFVLWKQNKLPSVLRPRNIPDSERRFSGDHSKRGSTSLQGSSSMIKSEMRGSGSYRPKYRQKLTPAVEKILVQQSGWSPTLRRGSFPEPETVKGLRFISPEQSSLEDMEQPIDVISTESQTRKSHDNYKRNILMSAESHDTMTSHKGHVRTPSTDLSTISVNSEEGTHNKKRSGGIGHHQKQQVSTSGLHEGSKSKSRISYGDLDICRDPLARTPSAHARTLIQELAKSKFSVSAHGMERIDTKIPRKSTSPEERANSSDTSGSISGKVTRSKDGKRTRGHKKKKTKGHTALCGVPSGRVSTESQVSENEEITEVHHIGSSTVSESNPIGSMRKRFHQFLDDAFNAIGEKDPEPAGTSFPTRYSFPCTSRSSADSVTRRCPPETSEPLSTTTQLVATTTREWVVPSTDNKLEEQPPPPPRKPKNLSFKFSGI